MALRQLENETRRRVGVETQLQNSATAKDTGREPLLPSARREGSGARLPKLAVLLETHVGQSRPVLLQAARWVDELLQVVDRLALQASRLLRQFPGLRLAFAAYALLLHLWLLVLLIHMAPEAKKLGQLEQRRLHG